MSQTQLTNLLVYCGVAVANILLIAVGASLAAGTLPGFRDVEPLAPARAELVALLALLGPILTTWLAANRPRVGREEISGLVNDVGPHAAKVALRSEVMRQAVAVGGLSQEELLRQLEALSPEQRDRLTASLEKRNAALARAAAIVTPPPSGTS